MAITPTAMPGPLPVFTVFGAGRSISQCRGFGQDQDVTGTSVTVGRHLLGVDGTGRGQAEDRLLGLDGITKDDGDPSFRRPASRRSVCPPR